MILGKKDKLGMRAFVKALFLLLKDKEGIVVEVDKKLYVVHKGRHEDGEMKSANRVIFAGDFVDGRIVKGRVTFPDGQYYEGTFTHN